MNKSTKPTLASLAFNWKPSWQTASVLFYGPAGVGKTTLAGKAPNLLILDAESRCRGIEGMQIPVDDFDQLDEYLYLLATEKHPYTSVLLDGIDVLCDRALEMARSRASDGNGNGNGNGNRDGRSPYIGLTQRLTSSIRRFCELPYLTIATAHAQDYEEPQSEKDRRANIPKDKRTFVNLPKEARANVEHAFDVIAYCYRDPINPQRRLFCADPQVVDGFRTYGKDSTGALTKPQPMEWPNLAKALGL